MNVKPLLTLTLLMLMGCQTAPTNRSAATQPSKPSPVATGYSENVTAPEPSSEPPAAFTEAVASQPSYDPAPMRSELPAPDTIPASSFINPVTGQTNAPVKRYRRLIRPRNVSDEEWQRRVSQ